MKPLILPARLNVIDVVNSWWLREADTLGVVVSDDDRYRLRVLAAAMNNLPRMLEFGSDYITRQLRSKKSQLTIDKAFIDAMFTRINDDYKSSYVSGSILPPPLELKAAIYGEKITVTENVMNLIRRSIFTNSISKFSNPNLEEHIMPEMSIFVLYASAIECLQNVSTQTKTIAQLIINTFDGISKALRSGEQEGDILEASGRQWLKVRLSAVKYARIKMVPLCSIFSLDIEEEPVLSRQPLFSTVINTDDFGSPRTTTPPNVYDDETAFLQHINDLEMDDDAIILLESCPGQCFDAGFIARDTNTNELVLVFIDFKSRRERTTAAASSKKPPPKKNKMKQYRRIKGCANNMARLVGESKLSVAGRAFANQRYVFIYMSTHDYKMHLDKQKRCLLMGREKTRKFFTCLWDIYVAARACF